jgi:hypothetical protein
MWRAFPPDRTPTFRVRRVAGSGDVWTVETIGNYGADFYFVV